MSYNSLFNFSFTIVTGDIVEARSRPLSQALLRILKRLNLPVTGSDGEGIPDPFGHTGTSVKNGNGNLELNAYGWVVNLFCLYRFVVNTRQ